jgi:transposase
MSRHRALFAKPRSARRRPYGLRTGDGRALPTRLKAEIARELKRLEVVLDMIATVETERDVILTSASSTHLNAGKIKMLARLKAIGPEFASSASCGDIG